MSDKIEYFPPSVRIERFAAELHDFIYEKGRDIPLASVYGATLLVIESILKEQE